MKNFTPFTESLPEQGRWILVIDESLGVKKNNEPFYLWLANKIEQDQLGKFYVFSHQERAYTEVTHWKYAIEEGE